MTIPYGIVPAWKIAKIIKRTKLAIYLRAMKLNLKSDYQLNMKGKNNPMYKHHHSIESIEKISIAKKLQYKNIPSLRKKMDNQLKKNHLNWKGGHHSEETKRKIGLGNKGKFVSETTKLKLKNRDYNWQRGNKNPMRKYESLQKNLLSNFSKPTIPEKQVMQIIKLNNLPFNYTGDGKVIINGFCPDFLSKNPKYIIEVNGNYWHNLEDVKKRDKRKIKLYSSLGYKTLTVWEFDLRKDAQRVTERIVNFITS